MDFVVVIVVLGGLVEKSFFILGFGFWQNPLGGGGGGPGVRIFAMISQSGTEEKPYLGGVGREGGGGAEVLNVSAKSAENLKFTEIR